MTEKQIRETRMISKEERAELAKGVNACVDLLVVAHDNAALAKLFSFALVLTNKGSSEHTSEDSEAGRQGDDTLTEVPGND